MTGAATVQRGYRLRLYPNATQQKQLAVCFGHSRWAYNTALDAIGFGYRTQGQQFTTRDCSKAITELKRDPAYAWLGECPRTCITESLRSLDRAFSNFFSGQAKYPRFKKKAGRRAVTFQLPPSANHCTPGEWLRLPSLGCVKVRWSCVPGGVPKMATVSRSPDGQYHVSFMVEESVHRRPIAGGAIGVDVGVKDVAVTSDGWHSGAPRATYRLARQLRHEQRALARKTKGSRRRTRQAKKVARVQAKIGRVRADFLHNTSWTIAKSASVVCIEDVNIAGMLRNRALSKAVADAGLGELRRQIAYKAAWHGRTVVVIDRWFPSTRMCSGCGALHDMPLGKRRMICPCGVDMDRDENAARNIRAEGVRSLSGASPAEHVEGDTFRPVDASAPAGAASDEACRPGRRR